MLSIIRSCLHHNDRFALPKTQVECVPPDDICAICLDGNKNKDWVKLSYCIHKYHVECIIRVKDKCPICRTPMNLTNSSSISIQTVEFDEDYSEEDDSEYYDSETEYIRNFRGINYYSQPPEICLAAVRKYGLALQYVANKTPEICLAAVQQNGYALLYVKEQTPEICMAAVQKNGEALKYVKEQTSQICMAAIEENYSALQYVKKQTPEICLAAVLKDSFALQYIKKQTSDICLVAVQQNGNALQYVKNQTTEICSVALKQNRLARKYVKIILPLSSSEKNKRIKSPHKYSNKNWFSVKERNRTYDNEIDL